MSNKPLAPQFMNWCDKVMDRYSTFLFRKTAGQMLLVAGVILLLTILLPIGGELGPAQAQTVMQNAFKWPEPVGWYGYGGGVYVYEADSEFNPFPPVLAAFITNHPQVRVVSVVAEGFSKKYEDPKRTQRYIVVCEPVGK